MVEIDNINQFFVTGLSDEEVALRVERGQVNGDQNIKTKSIGEIIRTHVFTFFNFIFLIFALIIIIFKLGWTQLGFMGLVIGNALIGFIQELAAKKTVDRLSLLSQAKVTAIRNSQKTEIALQDIVMDDCIILETGNQVCSDAIVLSGYLEVDESQITGESETIAKHPGDEVYSGSYVASGKAVTKVIRVGKENYATRISVGAKYIKPNSSVIMRDIMRFIKFMTLIIVPLGIILFCTKLLFHDVGYITALRDSVTLLVGMIPSGLVALTTAIFCVGVVKMARHKALAQDLFATEALARVDVLCIDKTGTITEGTMEVIEVASFSKYSVDEIDQLIKDIVSGIGDNNTTANALKDYTANKYKSRDPISFVSFSSKRKWSAANFEEGGYVIGAPEFVLTKIPAREKQFVDQKALEGYRVLVLARTNYPLISGDTIESPETLAYIVISDKIRPEAYETLAFFAEQGVKIKVLSGDNPLTVRSVARRAGLADSNNFIDASTLKDEDIPNVIDHCSIFGRVSPHQKLLFVRALKNKGMFVGMTGDGVNDVLALKESDCSVAMAAGSDAAKNVAQIVLLDSNFASMPKIVAEGRKSVNNLGRSAALYLVKTFFSVILALTFLMLDTPLPFILSHQTLLGALTTGTPSFLLALERNTDPINTNFLDSVIQRALPGSFVLFIAVLYMTMIQMFAPGIDTMFTQLQYQSVTLIVMAFVSFIFLGNVCLPMNIRRFIMIALLIGIFAYNFFLPLAHRTILITSDLPIEGLYIALPIALATVPLLTFFNYCFIGFARRRHASNVIDALIVQANVISDFYKEQRQKYRAKRKARATERKILRKHTKINE